MAASPQVVLARKQGVTSGTARECAVKTTGTGEREVLFLVSFTRSSVIASYVAGRCCRRLLDAVSFRLDVSFVLPSHRTAQAGNRVTVKRSRHGRLYLEAFRQGADPFFRQG